MTVISTKKIKVLLIIIFLLILSCIILSIFSIKRKNNKKEKIETPVLELAPENIYKSRNIIKLNNNKGSFYVDENNNIVIKDESGNSFLIDKDGNIFKIDENGKNSIGLSNNERVGLAGLLDEIKKKYFQNDKALKKAIDSNESELYKGLSGAQENKTTKQTATKKETSVTKNSNTTTTTDNSTVNLNENKTKEESSVDKLAESKANKSDFITLDTSSISKGLNNMAKTDYEKQNMQGEKASFLEGLQGQKIEGSFLTENDIAPGTIVSITLLTGINSDLPGMIIATTNHNLYDSKTGKRLLLAKGTKLIANYDSCISFGQERILIAWTSLSRSDGYTCSLPGFQGVDNLGRSGYSGKVNNHFWKIIGSTALSTLVDIPTIALSKATSNETLQSLLNSITSNTSTVSKELIEKRLNQQPTITIDPGKTCKMIINKTLTLPVQEVI